MTREDEIQARLDGAPIHLMANAYDDIDYLLKENQRLRERLDNLSHDYNDSMVQREEGIERRALLERDNQRLLEVLEWIKTSDSIAAIWRKVSEALQPKEGSE